MKLLDYFEIFSLIGGKLPYIFRLLRY